MTLSKLIKLTPILAAALALVAVPAMAQQFPSDGNLTFECDRLLIRNSCEILRMEQEMTTRAVKRWSQYVPMLYIDPTQTVWNGIKEMALAPLGDAAATVNVRDRVNRALDAYNNQFLYDANGDINKLRKNILMYLMGTDMSAEAIQLLVQIDNSNLNLVGKKALAMGLGTGTEPAKIRMLMTMPPPDPGTAMPGYHMPGTQPALSSSLPQVQHYSLYPSGTPATTGQTAYADGQRDRQAWEHWYNNLPEGDYKRGAFYWSSVRSTNKAASACQVSVQYAAWISGCHAAKAMLDPSDNRRDTEPDYRAGWNSL